MKAVAGCVACVFVVLALVLLLWDGMPPADWNAVNALAAVLGGLAASAGLLFVGLQMRAGRRLARAQFVNELGRDVDLHCEVESCLDREGPWYNEVELTHEDMDQIELYLNFFERVKYIRDTNVLDMETIDGLFAYRFFHLVHNPNVQKRVLYHEDMVAHYQAIRELYAEWVSYRQSRKLKLPRPTTPWAPTP